MLWRKVRVLGLELRVKVEVLHRAQAIDIQDAIQVIGLMLNQSSQEPTHLHDQRVSLVEIDWLLSGVERVPSSFGLAWVTVFIEI